VELFLVEIMGMAWSEVHSEAERLEHVISDRLLERMDEMLGSPSVDPHGDPIPSPQGVVVEPEFNTLLCCPVGAWLQVARVSDQSAEFLRLLENRGLLLGSRLRVAERDELKETVDLEVGEGRPLSLGFRAADKIQVAALSV
jgi:DtxR family Mn-dependent transcriptional regulator